MMVSKSFHNDFKTAVLLGMPFSFPLKQNSRNWLIGNNNNNNNNNMYVCMFVCTNCHCMPIHEQAFGALMLKTYIITKNTTTKVACQMKFFHFIVIV